MNAINIPTTEYMFNLVLKDFVVFEDDKILLSESTPKELALFLNITMSDKIRLVFIPDDNTCKCGSKTHKHTIIQWIMDKKYIFL